MATYTTSTDLAADVRERLGLPELPDDAVRDAFHALPLPSHRYEQIDAPTLERILRVAWDAATDGSPYPYEPFVREEDR